MRIVGSTTSIFIFIMFYSIRAFKRLAFASRTLAGKAHPQKPSALAVSDFPLAKSFAPAVNDLFGNLLSNLDHFPSLPNLPSVGTFSSLATDVKEKDSCYEIVVDIPGVHKKDITISHEDHELTISAERSGMKKEEGENYRRVERYAGHVSRTFSLPRNCDVDKIEAECKDGVLKITVPKTEGEKGLQRIEVK